jgi:nicotinate-nucleotide adenylyltransferase
MRIGVFGGTFDPPHLAHLALAMEASYQLGLDRLLWVLTPDPPHKQGRAISPAATRLGLVEAAIGGNPAFEISRVELDRPGPHYALDTVRLLKAQFAGCELAYLIGGDSLRDLPTWHRPAELVQAVDRLGVMRRPGDEVDLTRLEAALPGLTEKVRWVQAPLLEISGTDIRRRVRAVSPYRYYVPEAVYSLIEELKLYREAESVHQ